MSSLQNNSNQSLPIIGILGDGQLSMMMADAYRKLGGKVHILGSSDDGPASSSANKVFVGDPNKFAEMQDFFNSVDVVTLENEFLDSKLLSFASSETNTPIYPDPKRFALIEDKLSEKNFFKEQGTSLAPFFEVKSVDDLVDKPGYLKLAKGGYDGIGTYRVDNKQAAIELFEKIQSSGVVLFEEAINFTKELSLIGVSDTNETVFYPLVETHQEHGTCRYVSYPCGVSEEIEQQAQSQVQRILDKLGTRGLFAFEYFLTADNQLILNESAPRPHNSGHITMDLYDCCQFENHMRSVANLPLVTPKLLKPSMTMVNLLGTRNGKFDGEQLANSINDNEASLTHYRKHESRVNRKMAHINVWGDKQQQRSEDFVSRLEV